MHESDILHTAIENLEKQTQAKISIFQNSNGKQLLWDALIEINANGVQTKFKVGVKNRVHQSNLPVLLDSLKKEENILVAAYISKPGKKLLEEKSLNYLDVAGNCFIKSANGIFWKINNAEKNKAQPVSKHRIFHKNGIKLIFALLIQKNLINATYREQAKTANISVSTVGGIHEDLKASKFLYQLNKHTKQLVNKEELLSQWVQNYQQRLKPKLFRGRFRFLNGTVRDWQKIKLTNTAFWSGEPAAEVLTNFLTPEILTLYTNLDRNQLISDLKLIPDQNGPIEINSIFWDLENDFMTNSTYQTVHPILVYADLLSAGDSRNLETAKRIYEQYLQNIFE